jgi:predicted alpha/beta-fold hydrolase
MVNKYDLNLDKIRQAQTWRELDEEYTIKVHKNFKSASAYYNASSCLMQVHEI